MIAFNQLALIDTTPPPQPLVAEDPSVVAAGRLIALWLADNKSPATRDTYAAAIRDFANFLQAPTIQEATARMLSIGKGPATAALEAYRATLVDVRKLAPNSANIKVAAVRSLLAKAYDLDMVGWLLRVRGLRTENLRDTRGPAPAKVNEMFQQLGRQDAKGRRDRALFRLLWDLALRRAEVISLDLEHVDLEKSVIWAKGKGRRERSWISLPDETRDALAAWIEARGTLSGPLFVSLHRSGGARLTGHALHQIVRDLGRACGVKVWPHAFRHASVTAALDKTNGDVRTVRLFSRHQSMETLLRYDDARQDRAGGVAKLVAELLKG
jgi:integrase/recombinase XerC